MPSIRHWALPAVAIALLPPFLLTGCAGLAPQRVGVSSAGAVSADYAGSSADSANSSAASGDSSGASAESSEATGSTYEPSLESAESSRTSGGSSMASADSSAASADSSRASDGSSASSDASSRGTADSSGRGGSSDVVASANQVSRGDSMAIASASGLLLTTVGGIAAAIYGSMKGARRHERGKTASLYLKAMKHQLRQDLALGAGPAIDDLAGAAEIRLEHRARFGRLLQAHRRELLELGDATAVTPDRALRWLERVGELVKADPILQQDCQAWSLKAEEAPSVCEPSRT